MSADPTHESNRLHLVGHIYFVPAGFKPLYDLGQFLLGGVLIFHAALSRYF